MAMSETKLHTGTPEDMGRRLIDAWKRAEHGEEVDESHLTFPSKQELLVYLLREHGIGIASLDEMEARTRAVARGELKLPPDEPKLWFSSIEAMVKALQECYFGSPSEDF